MCAADGEGEVIWVGDVVLRGQWEDPRDRPEANAAGRTL